MTMRRYGWSVAFALAVGLSSAGTPGAAENVVKIGALLPISGPGSYFGAQDRQGIELALEEKPVALAA